MSLCRIAAIAIKTIHFCMAQCPYPTSGASLRRSRMEMEEREKELREALDAQWEIPQNGGLFRFVSFRENHLSRVWHNARFDELGGFLRIFVELYSSIRSSISKNANRKPPHISQVVKPGNVSGHIFTGRPHHNHCFSLAESFEKGHNISDLWMIMAGWWFGTMEFYDFPYIYILGFSSSQVTFTPSFFSGVAKNHQPAMAKIPIIMVNHKQLLTIINHYKPL